MPMLRLCSVCFKPFAKLTKGMCAKHFRAEQMKRGMTKDWERKSLAYRHAHPHCDVCGTTEDCTVDHINGRQAGDGWDNLMTLCRSHHASLEQLRRKGL